MALANGTYAECTVAKDERRCMWLTKTEHVYWRVCGRRRKEKRRN